MARLKCKFKGETLYQATVQGVTLQASGRMKREATKRLRKKFLDHGISTRPSMMVDLLNDGKDVTQV